MAPVAIVFCGSLIFPMTIEAGSVRGRNRLERIRFGNKRIRPSLRGSRQQTCPGRMTDGAVVVVDPVLWRMRKQDALGYRLGARDSRPLTLQQCNHVLVLVMRKFNSELTGPGWIPKSEPGFVSGRDLRVTARANHRLSALKELRAVTTNTGVMIGKIRDVGKTANLVPI